MVYQEYSSFENAWCQSVPDEWEVNNSLTTSGQKTYYPEQTEIAERIMGDLRADIEAAKPTATPEPEATPKEDVLPVRQIEEEVVEEDEEMGGGESAGEGNDDEL
jgi:hypothetical protein